MRLSLAQIMNDPQLKKDDVQRFRNTFGHPEGQYVLGRLLQMLGYFDPEIDTEGMTQCRNVATEILFVLSGYDDNELTKAVVTMATSMRRDVE